MKRLILVVVLAALVAPAAAATPLQCADPCTVSVMLAGFVAPVAEIATGTQVKWVTSSDSHPTSNALNGDPSRCFLVAVGPNVTPVPVRFDIVAGGVTATEAPGTDDEVTGTCGNAVSLPAGAYLLQFQCMLHPWMLGELLIEP